ncbi:DUF2860 family protein [Vibrio crassostreae]|uniref:DUF2860 family protein n=1 Tax=Vibrio crassostreae TaxID=246167 RepID=UPI002FE33F26
MKKISLPFISLLSTLPLAAQAFDSSRVSGEFSVNTGFATSNSNLNPNGDRMLKGLNNNVSHTNEIFAAPLGNLNLALDTQDTHRVYAGTSRDDLAVGTLAFEVGYQRDLPDGTQIDIAYLPTIVSGEVWDNPYLEGTQRITTDVEGDAYRLKLSNIANTGVSFDLGYATSELDNEGVAYQELAREHDTYFLKGQYLSMLNHRSGLITAFSYTDHNAEGSAASYNQYKIEATYFANLNDHHFAVTSSHGYRDFESVNPLFNQGRADYFHRVFVAYEYNDIPNWENWSVTSFGGATLNTSNIDFYQSTEFLMSVGLNYRF